MIYLLEKEKITNQTTVLGIVDVAWCKRKSKLLLNIASNQRDPSSKILKWIDRINILEFNLSKLYIKMKKKTFLLEIVLESKKKLSQNCQTLRLPKQTLKRQWTLTKLTRSQ